VRGVPTRGGPEVCPAGTAPRGGSAATPRPLPFRRQQGETLGHSRQRVGSRRLSGAKAPGLCLSPAGAPPARPGNRRRCRPAGHSEAPAITLPWLFPDRAPPGPGALLAPAGAWPGVLLAPDIRVAEARPGPRSVPWGTHGGGSMRRAHPKPGRAGGRGRAIWAVRRPGALDARGASAVRSEGGRGDSWDKST
jgi:hypothetical protein